MGQSDDCQGLNIGTRNKAQMFSVPLMIKHEPINFHVIRKSVIANILKVPKEDTLTANPLSKLVSYSKNLS